MTRLQLAALLLPNLAAALPENFAKNAENRAVVIREAIDYANEFFAVAEKVSPEEFREFAGLDS